MKVRIALALSTCVGAVLCATSAWAQDSGGSISTPAATGSDATTGTAANGASNSDVARNSFNEIVVTARRRAEDISKVPVSVTAFGSAQIETKNIQNVADLTKLTPGLNITGGGSRTNVFVTIRGQSRGVTGNVSPGVLTYFNEVPLPTYGSLIPTFDMDSIQVLKGPQGTLFGRNSIGGAILTYSKAPTHEFGGYFEGEIGQYDRRKIEGAVNLPIGEKIALRLSAQQDYSAGYTKNYQYTTFTLDPVTRVATPPQLVPSDHNFDEFKSTSVRVSLLIEPFDGIKNVTVFDYTKVRGATASNFTSFFPTGVPGRTTTGALYFLSPTALTTNFGPVIGGNIARLAQCGTSPTCDYRLFQQQANSDGRRVTYSNADPYDTATTIWGISNTTTVEINDDMTLKNIFGYRTNDSLGIGDNDGTPLNILDTRNFIQTKIVTEELQLSGSTFNDKLKYTVGGFYFKQSPDGPGGSAALEINTFFGLSHNATYAYFTDKSKALYGQVDYALDWLTEGLTLTAGYRQTWDTSGGCVAAQTFSPFVPGLVTGTAANPIPGEANCRAGILTPTVASASSSAILPPAKFKKGTYNLGLNWQVTPDALIYFAKRRGYRAGSYNAPLYDAFLASVQTFSPETLDDIELGTKLRWRGSGMSGSIDLAVFRGIDKDVQIPFQTSQLVAGTAGLGCVPEAANTPGSTAPLCTTASGLPGRRVPVPAATTYVNAGKSVLQGFEVAATLSPLEGLVLSAGASYLDFKAKRVTNDPNLDAVFRANNRISPGFVLRQQPKWTVTGGVFFQFPDDVLGGQLAFNSDVRYTSSYLEGDFFLAGKTTVDANVGISGIGGTGLDATFVVTNLFDEKYNYGSVGSAAALGYLTTIYGQPRTLSLQLRYKFGE
jgi:iron complex outermembrane receptor protein